MPVEGNVKLLLTLGMPPTIWTQSTQFLVVKLLLAYNTILDRPVLYDFEVATSIQYLCMTFPTKGGAITVKGRQEESRSVYLATMAREEEEDVCLEIIEVRDEEKEQRTQLMRELESIILTEENPEKTFSMNINLKVEQKTAIKALVRGHTKSFAWRSAV